MSSLDVHRQSRPSIAHISLLRLLFAALLRITNGRIDNLVDVLFETSLKVAQEAPTRSVDA